MNFQLDPVDGYRVYNVSQVFGDDSRKHFASVATNGNLAGCCAGDAELRKTRSGGRLS